MPLTKEEREFLDAYLVEATDGPPFGGPATAELARHDIYYSDLSWILTAYDRERCAERREFPTFRNPNPPPRPWMDKGQVRQRNQDLHQELEPAIREAQAASVHR
jgi:hypothetical protein